jgi:hypothetical protein
VDGVALIVVVVCGTDDTACTLARGFIHALPLKHKLKTKVEVRGKNQAIGND